MSSRSPDGRQRYLKSCIGALLLLLAWPAAMTQALPDDRDQPIHISADQALRDEKQGFTVYSGNVHMKQGSMEIEADKLTIYHVSEEADKIVAEGLPAKMRQQPEPDEGLIHAHAELIEYFKVEERVHLQTNARIEQDGALVTGDSIDYLIVEQLVRADSDETLDGDRVKVVIPPTLQPAAQDAAPGEQPQAPPPAENPPPQAQAPAATTPPDTPAQPTDEQQEEDASGATESE